ncbi:filamentous hemagglutinin N-terminal domain-containing protein [Nostoc flagelliforme FACHB-838]|uniref:Filamentous hemagglutinin N-terminal domain-containing protein n=1 Tax=Nostoc flagelliforme FACHB-838 TaxID=2692904 RepID=A0ABR8DT19_9NOSO|nr:filamentous hemagglutinin N-terminal domain-containing protein [Nostoc flagelliforme]MBD2532373.1 filamentous hemagglutinin N-terminal domain-containing protein [Nostoc flagelliforme FACHB-838]
MIIKSWFGRGLEWKIGGCVALVAVLSIGVSDRVNAQIVPDKMLGAEGSVVTPNVNIQGISSDRIDGGATRGANLFHSLQDFNVGEGKGAYFANPTGIENILTRVTGGNASNILGRLGVLGGANLFLLNPNGIIFGPNASLDIQGSFLATTADRIQLGDSGYFSATQPQTSSLLSVTPGALFFNAVASQPGSIINQGNLSTGKHLTLSAGNLDLQGQLKALGDLTLQAQDTVKVRDAIASPIIATSGRNLTIQGNQNVDILALSHPLSKIGSGGNLNLVSDGDISLDAHFESGGNLSMLTDSGTPGNFVSMFGSIIQANGDILFGDYTGVALKVEATGSIQGGNIKITGAECAAGSTGCAGGIPTTDSDFATLTDRPTVILRAELASVNTPNLTQNAGSTEFTATLGLPLGISVGNIDTFSRNGGNGGDIILSAAKGSINTGNLRSLSSSPSGNAGQGGAINLTAANDINTTGNLYSFSYSESGNAGQGGAINLTAANDINTTGNLYSYSFSLSGDAGQGGAINLTAANDINTTGNLSSYSLSVSGDAGQGGAINLNTDNGSITTGTLVSGSSSGSGNAGQGGAINLTAANDINTTGNLYSYSYSGSGNAGQGGAINLTAANDINITGDLSSYSYSGSDNADQGGAINLTAANEINITGDLSSYSYSGFGNAGQGGAINLNTANDINTTGSLYSFSYSPIGTAGQGGAISLRTRGGDISGRGNQSTVLGSFSISEQGTAGNGGNVALEAKNNVSNLEILTLSSDSKSGVVQVKGLGDLVLTDTNILTSKQVTVPVPFEYMPYRGFITLTAVRGFITLTADGEGESGEVTVTSSGNLTFNNSSIQSDTKGSDSAGNVTVISPGLVTFNNSSIRSSTSNTGAAGSIGIEADQGITLVGSNSELSALFAGTTNQGEAGNITLTTPELTLQNGAKIATTTASSSPAGVITLQSHPNRENLNINLASETSISASTSNQGIGGNIEIKAPNAITIQGQGTITTETTGDGAAGELRIDTQKLTIADGATISASTDSKNPEGTGGSIDIKATESFNLTNASLDAKSTGAAPAGNIKINTPNLTATNGKIATSSNESSGGDINITASKIHLFGNTDITTFVAQGAGGGGNIKLTADSIVAFNDSDILAYAPGGTGGNITLNTPAFFGEDYRPAPRNTDPRTLNGNDRVDVNATGAVEGVITLPDTTFIQNSLSELPENQINTESLLANSCIVRRNQPTRGSFTITGTGGLPQRPGDAQMSSFPTVNVETLPSESTLSTTNPNRPWQKGDPIIEPLGVYRLSNGKLVLSRECS